MTFKKQKRTYANDSFSPDAWYSSYDSLGAAQPNVGPRIHPERAPGPVTYIDPKDYVKPAPIKKKVYLTEEEERKFEELSNLCGL